MKTEERREEIMHPKALYLRNLGILRYFPGRPVELEHSRKGEKNKM